MSKPNGTRASAGIEVYHQKHCRTREGERRRCNCVPSYRGKVTGPEGRIASPWFKTLAAAVNWRIDTLHAINAGTFVQPTAITVREAAAEFIDGIRAEHIHSRRGLPYSPSTVRDYEGDLNRHVLPKLGDLRLSNVRRREVQTLVDDLNRQGLSASTVRNALDPLRRIFGRAVHRELIPFSPCQNVELPSDTGIRDHVATPAEADALIAALPPEDRALWAMLFYAGLRMGEARALRVCDVDLPAKRIRVRGSWDDKEGAQDRGKTNAATRDVTIIEDLRPFLAAHVLSTGRRGDDLIFGRTANEAVTRSTVRSRARRAWKEAKLTPITPHECRHTFGSMIAAAGVDAGERQRQMGHASSAMMDRYTHGLIGSLEAAGEKLQRWLEAQRSEALG